MDDPVSEIAGIIQTLCTACPSKQREAIDDYFVATASFTHPLCRTGSFIGSRWLIAQIYRWYKILSPHIDVAVDSIAFDEDNMLLYVSLHQTFKIAVIPFYRAEPSLVSVLKLTNDPEPHFPEITGDPPEKPKPTHAGTSKPSLKDGSANKHTKRSDKKSHNGNEAQAKKYYIQSQNDLYQTSEWIKFIVPFGIGVTLMVAWQTLATYLCVLGAFLGYPVTWFEENALGGNVERARTEKA